MYQQTTGYKSPANEESKAHMLTRQIKIDSLAFSAMTMMEEVNLNWLLNTLASCEHSLIDPDVK